jgi:Enoyl-CoA hydratase/isomerase
MSMYDLPDEIQVDVDGPVRVVRLNRPERLNATNYVLHRALARVSPQIDADGGARAAVLTGAGRAFSAGGDFPYLADLAADPALRKETLADAHQIVTGMIRCRVPIIAAARPQNGRVRTGPRRPQSGSGAGSSRRASMSVPSSRVRERVPPRSCSSTRIRRR